MDRHDPGIEFLGRADSSSAVFAGLPAPVRDCFRRHFDAPTVGQRMAWPALAAGKNLLLCAPTGSGKTLAAFLPLVARLLAGPPADCCRYLYIAPLRALVNDTRKTLRYALRRLRPFLPHDAPRICVGVRTGDTDERIRRRYRRRPPAILLTTPESLAVLLSQPTATQLFADLQAVVVDEIHALAATKRGADLALSLERLEALARTAVQRIGLSATCQPLGEVARFLVGTQRACAIARVPDETALHLSIEPLPDEGTFLASLMDRLEAVFRENKTTLIFTNTRALAERLAWALSRRFPDWAEQIGVHHSSLDATRRREVERRLKAGRLRSVVSSTSLELGIDIGSVDQVVLIHPPGDAVRLLQRVGRAGHGPRRPRRGLILTATAAELLEAAVTGAAGQAGQLEPIRTERQPLDVLCQHLVGMAAAGSWEYSDALQLVRRAFPYQELTSADFDACLDYLSGRKSDGSSWLPPRLRWRGDQFTIMDQRTARLLRRNLGTIIAEETRAVRLARPGAWGQESMPLGNLDEAFADRLAPGDRFLLDGRCLQVRQMDWQHLIVEEVAGCPAVPRWGSEGWPLSGELASRLYLLRIRAAEALRDGPAALLRLLRQEYALGADAAHLLLEYFQRQELVSEIPDADAGLIEIVDTGFAAEAYLHTPLNRSANDALARVVTLRVARRASGPVVSIVADLGFMVAGDVVLRLERDDWRDLLAPANFDRDLDHAIGTSITLRARFRRVALTGLMLLRNPLGGRRRVGGPDWAERRLFDQILAAAPDFVLLEQARREVRQTCDASSARQYLEDLSLRLLRMRQLGAVSPFAENWTQLSAGPAEGIESTTDALKRLHASLTTGDSDDQTRRIAAVAASEYSRVSLCGDSGRPPG